MNDLILINVLIFINSVSHNYFHLKINKILTIRFNLLLRDRRDYKQYIISFNPYIKYYRLIFFAIIINIFTLFLSMILKPSLKKKLLSKKVEAKYLKK